MHADTTEARREEHVSLLLVGRIEERAPLERALREQVPAVSIRQVPGIEEAVRLLEEVRFDLVLADHELEEGTSLDLLARLQEEEVYVPVVVQAAAEDQRLAFEVLKAGARDVLLKGAGGASVQTLSEALLDVLRRHRRWTRGQARARRKEQQKILDDIRSAISTVTHEINNPLAIISGNAQLLLELSRVFDLDEEITRPIQDIEEATRRLAAAMRRLNDLKEELRT